jgi:hypothetical protein
MDEQTQPKTRGRRPKVIVAPREELAFDVDSVIARRLAGEPFGARQQHVPLREPKRWATYEANSLADRNAHYRMVHEFGWVPVRVEDLAPGIEPVAIGWQVDAAGALCRGPQGDSKLYKQPQAVRDRITAAKTAANMKGIGSAKAVKESVAQAAGSQLGSEAGDFAHSNITVTGADRIQGGAS